MEDYPESYVTHNHPLIVLSGLGNEPAEKGQETAHRLPRGDGATVHSDLPLATGDRADELLNDLLAASGTQKLKNAHGEPVKSSLIGFQLEAVGRKYTLPARKAAPPPSSPTMSPQTSQSINFPANRALHSPLSPLSPGSPIYPDGIMTQLWLEKHQYDVPAVFVSFIPFTSDPTRDSLNDNFLKNEINNIKSIFTRSGHRTRYAIVLISERTILEAPEIEERLSIIRRATGLDPKSSLFFLPPNTSKVELLAFATNLLSTLQPVCIEYYRDLTKHARRKKTRGAVPPPTAPPTKGTSQTLSTQGWSIRYDFKGGIFAEFRQEMEAAGRNYTMALDTLLGSDGIFETAHSWSGRWDEARLLADALALRIIRCFLWNNQTTSAVQFWTKYRDSIREILDRRGKGTATYGWQVWMARWAKSMAETMQETNLPSQSLPNPRGNVEANDLGQVRIHAPAEKLFPVGERLPPWNLLAHPGYWLWLSARHSASRRKMAEDIPEEDRTPPGQSPATKVANRAQTYDYYLCPESHVEFTVDHGAIIRDALNLSTSDFLRRSQQRFAARLQLDHAKEFMRVKKYTEARDILEVLWQSMAWRAEGWWRLAFEVISTLYNCAVACKDATLIISTSWELLSNVFPTKPGHRYDLTHCLDALQFELDSEQAKPLVSLQGENICSFICMSCNFANADGHVGEPTITQCVIRSSARQDSAPVILSSIGIRFEGSLEQIRIRHHMNPESLSEKPKSGMNLQNVKLTSEIQRNSTHILSGSADLTLHPGQSIILECPITYKEAGDVRAIRASASIDLSAFSLNYAAPIFSDETSACWHVHGEKGVQKRQLTLEDPTAITIFPKPPKMEIALPNVLSQYYVSEQIVLEVELNNSEEEEANAEASLQIMDASGQQLPYKILSESTESKATQEWIERPAESEKAIRIGRIGPSENRTFAISLSAPNDPTSLSLEIASAYYLIGDPETSMLKTLSRTLDVSNPLEADYQVSTYIHPQPWPNFFSVDKIFGPDHPDKSITSAELDSGIARAWLISAHLTSFATDDLFLDNIKLVCSKLHGSAVYTMTSRDQSSLLELAPNQQHVHRFELVVRTTDLEERRPVTLDLALNVTWRRVETNSSSRLVADNQHTHSVKAQRTSVTVFLLLSPFIITSPEPRVVCTASHLVGNPQAHPVILLAYTIENPTTHFLTFSTMMEASDEFAFGGSKSTSLNLVPISRHTMRYHVMPLPENNQDSQHTILRPDLKITDVYFGQTLKVVPGDGVSTDKEGIFVDLSGLPYN